MANFMAHVEAALGLSPLPPPLEAALNSEAFFVDCHERFRTFDNDNSGVFECLSQSCHTIYSLLLLL
jgi:hypothetical protein